MRKVYRTSSLQDFRDLVRLTQHFDVLHMVPPLVEEYRVVIPDLPALLRTTGAPISTLNHSAR